MIRSIEQLPLDQRIPLLRDSVLAARARKEQDATDEAAYMDQLAQAEAAVAGKAPGSEGVALSGLIPEGENQYATPAPALPAGQLGDLVDPVTGEGSGGA